MATRSASPRFSAASSTPPGCSGHPRGRTAHGRNEAFLPGQRYPVANGWRWHGSGTCSSRGCSWSTGWLTSSTRSSVAIFPAIWRQWSRLASIGRSVRDHLLFRHPTGDAAKRYNVLQKLTYLIVIFGLLPLIILMGWAMSPWLDSVLPGWVDIFGGRQSARTIHFIVAWLLVAFVLIHVFEVVVTGVWNNLRSMITGRYRVTTEAGHETER